MKHRDWYTQSFQYFDTVNTISIWHVDDSILKKVAALCSHFQKLWNRFDPESDLAKISNHPGTYIQADPETIAVLKLSEEFRSRTQGGFHIGLGAFQSLWKSAEGWMQPSEEQLQESIHQLQQFQLNLTEASACINAGIILDLGGIAKGYIADQIRRLLKQERVPCAMIDLGGNIVTVGDKPDDSFWEVGIRSPFHTDKICGRVRFRGEKALVTSGIYERCSPQDSCRYHHIIDPESGAPVQSDLMSVTVFGVSGVQCDVLATALLVKGTEKGTEILRKFPGMQAIFIRKDGIWLQSCCEGSEGELLMG